MNGKNVLIQSFFAREILITLLARILIRDLFRRHFICHMIISIGVTHDMKHKLFFGILQNTTRLQILHSSMESNDVSYQCGFRSTNVTTFGTLSVICHIFGSCDILSFCDILRFRDILRFFPNSCLKLVGTFFETFDHFFTAFRPFLNNF